MGDETRQSSHLAHQQDHSSVGVLEVQYLDRCKTQGQVQVHFQVQLQLAHLVEEEEEVGEPHGGAEVVEDVTQAIPYLFLPCQSVFHISSGPGTPAL